MSDDSRTAMSTAQLGPQQRRPLPAGMSREVLASWSPGGPGNQDPRCSRTAVPELRLHPREVRFMRRTLSRSLCSQRQGARRRLRRRQQQLRRRSDHQRGWHPGERDRGDHRQLCVLNGDPERQDGPAGHLDQQAGRRALSPRTAARSTIPCRRTRRSRSPFPGRAASPITAGSTRS